MTSLQALLYAILIMILVIIDFRREVPVTHAVILTMDQAWHRNPKLKTLLLISSKWKKNIELLC